MLQFEGGSLLRHHVVCSILAKRPIRVTHIHADEDPMGLQPHEANFLKFIDRVTSGSVFQCTDHNTVLQFSPGMILGGSFSHEVPTTRCVTYLIEVALLLLPFAKFDSRITFVGATQGELDLSVDTIRTVTLRWLQLFGVQGNLRIIRRGAAPGGGGAVELEVKAIRRLTSATTKERGRVRRVRGIAFASRTAADLPQRMATAAKGELLHLLPDVYVVTDVDNGKANRNERVSGYGVVLVAETTSKLCVISQESVAMPQEAPEEVGKRAARLLFDQIYEGGCVDVHHQMLVLLLMALSPDEVSTVRFGQLSSSGVSALMLMDSYFGVSCAIKPDPSFAGPNLPPTTLVTCLGSNAINVWKKSS